MSVSACLFRPIGIAALAAMLCTAAPAAERLTAENAWVPWAPPAIKVHAAYLTIVNRSDIDQLVVEVPDVVGFRDDHDGAVEARSCALSPIPRVGI